MTLRLFRIYFFFLSQSVKKEMVYRANFVMFIVLDVFNVAISLIFFKVIFNENKYISGWDFGSVLILIGIVSVLRELSSLTFKEGFGMLGHLIPKGRFDLLLTKPFSTQLLTAFQEISINEGLGEGLFGLGLIIYGAWLTDIPINLLNAILFLLLFVFAFILHYSFTLLINSAAFWIYRTQGFHSFASIFLNAAQYPGDIFKGFFKIFFTLIVPASIVATVPAEALIGNLKFGSVALFLIITAAFFVIANLVWRKGIRRYESASS